MGWLAMYKNAKKFQRLTTAHIPTRVPVRVPIHISATFPSQTRPKPDINNWVKKDQLHSGYINQLQWDLTLEKGFLTCPISCDNT